MSWSTTALSTFSSDTEPTVLITFDSGKYVFNVGENVGRAWLSSSIYWRKTKGIFLSSIGTQRGGGLPGILMFLADAGISNVDVVGPRGLTHFLATMRSYLFRETMLVKRTELDAASVSITDPKPVFRDENLTVYGIPLSVDPPIHSSSTREEGVEEGEDSLADNGKRKRPVSPDSKSKRVHLRDEQAVQAGNVPLRERMSWPDFSPTALKDAEAEEWRQIAVDAMFPNTSRLTQATTSVESKKGSKGPKDKNNGAEKQLFIAPFDNNAAPRDQPRRKFSYTPGLVHKDKHLPRFERSETAETICYVCVGPRSRGKFDAAKAKALQIPRGPLLGKLAKGETVTFMVSDGKGGQEQRTVTPDECVGPSEASKVVIILDVPSQAHIASLDHAFEQSTLYRQLLSNASDEYTVSSIYHICGEGVLEDSRYKNFMNKFPVPVNHIVASREHTDDSVTFTSAALNQLTLNQLNEAIFPKPKLQPVPRKSLTDVHNLPPGTVAMARNLHIAVRPPKPPTFDNRPSADDRYYSTLTSSAPLALPLSTTAAFTAAKEEVRTMEIVERPSRPGDDIVIVPLGTSSAAPSKFRNVSATLIQIPRWGNVLLDCGEGTWGQMVRLFGDDPDCSTGAWQALRDLKCIFLSHIHGDHHIGLAKLLAMRRKLNPAPTEPLYVVGVYAVLLYLRELADIEDLDLDKEDGTGVVTILSDALNWKDPLPYHPTISDEPWMDFELARADATRMCQALDLEDFVTVDVRHRTRCYGVVLKHHDGWSITYSADTLPSDNLVEVGMNSTVLIHEATMADDEGAHAWHKAHSTLSQAIEIGRRMKADNILLTHFSTRYPKPPAISYRSEPDTTVPQPNIVMAFDLARLRVGEMHKFKAYLPAIQQCFSDAPEEEEIIQ